MIQCCPSFSSVPRRPRDDLHRLRFLDDLPEEVRPLRGLAQHDVRGHLAAVGHARHRVLPHALRAQG